MRPLKVKEFRSRSLSYESACVRVEVCEKDSLHQSRVQWHIAGRPFYSTDASKCFMDLGYAVERTSLYMSGGEGPLGGKDFSLACTEPWLRYS